MKKLTYSLLALCFLLVGCRNEETVTALKPTQMVKVSIPFSFLIPEATTDDGENMLRNATVIPEPENDFTLHVGSKYSNSASRSITSFSNVWVLTFAPDGTCTSSVNAGNASPGAPITTTLPIGTDMTLYILANGPDELSKPTTLTDFEGAGYYSMEAYANESEVPYIGKVSGVNVDENGRLFNEAGIDVQVPLKRIAAKLSLTCTYASSDYTISSVQLFNAPSKMYYIYSSTVADVRTIPLDAPSITGNTYTWFLGENIRGTGSSTSQFERYADKAPASSTYIRVTLQSTLSAETIAYDIYPGLNLTDNYDLTRNWDYIYTTTFNKNGSELSSDKRVVATNVPIDYTGIPSNCFIMAPGKSYKFNPRIKGEGQEVVGGTGLPVSHEVDAVRLIWQDTKSLVKSFGLSSDHRIAVVNLTSDLKGNAVVAAYKDGRVVWSWHLWVRDKGLDVYTSNGVSGMSCLLGALNENNSDYNGPTSRGLFYQWGRNIPFPRAAAINADDVEPVYDMDNNPVIFETSAGAQPVSTTIEHPTTFYYTNAGGPSWHTDGNDLWGGTSGNKTIFDPCPRGWKIPQNDKIWSTWTADTTSPERFVWEADRYSRLAYEGGGSRAFYPAAGYYSNTQGRELLLTKVGYTGRYWTAAYSGNKANSLYFTANITDSKEPDNNKVDRPDIDQTYGCNVRPVKY